MDAPIDVELAPPLDEHPDLALPADVARDAAAIVDAALATPPAATAPAAGVTAGPARAADASGLSDSQRAMLDFERQWWRRGGAKEQAIRDTFGVTPTRYYQDLNGVLDLPAAMRYDAALVHRLLRLRTEATRGRRLLD